MFEFYREENFKDTEIGRIPEDWRVVRLGEATEINKESIDPPKEAPNKEFYYIEIDSIRDGKIKSVKKIIGKNAPSRARRIVRENDVIMSTVRPYLKAFAIVPKEYDGQICSTGFAVLRCKKDLIIPEYLLYSLFMDRTIEQCNRLMVGGQYPALNQSHVKSLLIPLPPLEEQKAIANVLSKIDEAIQMVEDSIKQIERIKKGLMQKLLTEGYISGFMFDTNIFNQILDGEIRIEELPKLKYYVTHVQADEISKTPDPERRKKLLEIFREIKQERIPTESAVVDISRIGEAKVSDGDLYSKILTRLKELDKKAGKRIDLRQERDALIAETCIENNLVLVSDDENLRKVTKEFGGKAISLKQFLEGRYREFKDTEIGKIPEDWEVVRLGDICKFKRGFSYRSEQITKERTKIRFITINDLEKEGGLKQNAERVYIRDGVQVPKDFFLEHEDILIANTDMSKGFIIGAPLLIEIKDDNEKLVYSMDLTKLVLNKSRIYPRFLFYVLSFTPVRRIMKTFAQGTNVLHLNHNLAKNLRIPLPPLEEQKAIAEILSKVDKLIEVKKEKKKILERIKKGIMQKLLTGEIRIKVSE